MFSKHKLLGSLHIIVGASVSRSSLMLSVVTSSLACKTSGQARSIVVQFAHDLFLLQIVVTELMTGADLKADAVVTPALQACLAMLPAETEGKEAAADLLQYLTPSQKHLTMLQKHVQVIGLVIMHSAVHCSKFELTICKKHDDVHCTKESSQDGCCSQQGCVGIAVAHITSTT